MRAALSPIAPRPRVRDPPLLGSLRASAARTQTSPSRTRPTASEPTPRGAARVRVQHPDDRLSLEDRERYVGLVSGYGALEAVRGVDETPAGAEGQRARGRPCRGCRCRQVASATAMLPDACERQTRGSRRAIAAPPRTSGKWLDEAPAGATRAARDAGGSAVAHRRGRARLATPRGGRDLPRARRGGAARVFAAIRAGRRLSGFGAAVDVPGRPGASGGKAVLFLAMCA